MKIGKILAMVVALATVASMSVTAAAEDNETTAYSIEPEVPAGNVLIDFEVTQISDTERIVETTYTPLTKNRSFSGSTTFTRTAKHERRIGTSAESEQYETYATATLTGSFTYNTSTGAVNGHFGSKTYWIESGMKLVFTNYGADDFGGVLGIGISSKVYADYTITNAVKQSSNYTISRSCNTSGNIS